MLDTTHLETKEVLQHAKKYAIEQGISEIVVATTRGKTGVLAADLFPDDLKIVAVTHSTGFKEIGKQELTDENKKKMDQKNVSIFTGPMIFHTWNDYYRKKQGTVTTTTMIADTLRMFGQGTKVAVEIVAMAADAGLISEGPVLSIAGSRYGADTVLLVTGTNSKHLMDMKILDVIAKPKEW
jgi:uncharacterized protein